MRIAAVRLSGNGIDKWNNSWYIIDLNPITKWLNQLNLNNGGNMKTQTLKALSLKKHTISNLNNIEMKSVKGGTEKFTPSGCRTWISDCACPYTVKEDTCTCIPNTL
jgi:hypothetical protein